MASEPNKPKSMDNLDTFFIYEANCYAFYLQYVIVCEWFHSSFRYMFPLYLPCFGQSWLQLVWHWSISDWHKTDTLIYHLSADMVNTKLHIYHPVCSLLRRYIINENKHDSMKNCFILRFWQGQGWHQHLTLGCFPHHHVVDFKIHSTASYLSILSDHASLKDGKLNPIIESITSDLCDRVDQLRHGRISAHKWIKGERALGYKCCLSGGSQGKWALQPLCEPSH